MWRRCGVVVILLVTGLVATACSGSARQSGNRNGPVRYAGDGTFTMALSNPPLTLDPYRPPGSYPLFAYDSLINVGTDGKYVSGVAEKWSADNRSASFTLRPDVTCSDGTRLTASQVAADLRFVANPKNQSWLRGSAVPAEPFTVTADDAARTVKVVMQKPFGLLLYMVGQMPIMCAKGLRDPSLLKRGSDGTGPYVLSSVVPGQSYTFTRRDDYGWGPGGATTRVPGMPKTVVLKAVLDKTTVANLLLSGQVNLGRVGAGDAERLRAQGLNKIELPSAGAWMWFNHLAGHATADKRVRQALIAAVDLKQAVKINTGGRGGGAATGLIEQRPKLCPGDTVSGQLPAHDAVAAAALLDQAGWTKGADGRRTKGGKPLTIDLHFLTAENPLDKPTAEFLAQQWAAVGIQVKQAADTNLTFSKVLFQTGDFDVYLVGFQLTTPSDMLRYATGPTPPKGTNLAGIRNQNYDRLTAKAAGLTPPGACAYWNQAEQALYRDVDIAPIAARPTTYFLNKAEAQFGRWPIPTATSIRLLD